MWLHVSARVSHSVAYGYRQWLHVSASDSHSVVFFISDSGYMFRLDLAVP